jgi:trimeric autotransporter adhesin
MNVRAAFAAMAFLFFLPLHAAAQPDTWMPGPLSNWFEGVDGGSVRASIAWDPDGAGPQQEWLIVGGGFTSIEGVAATSIAGRDPATQRWQALGTGAASGQVICFAVYNGELYAGGGFSGMGGVAGTQYFARWNGTSWQSVGSGVNSSVSALGVYNGELIVGGAFTTAGGVAANHMARWNGSSWQAMGTGTDGGNIQSMCPYGGELIVGGQFTTAGGISSPGIAAWTGTAWRAFSGVGPAGRSARSMTIHQGDLVIGGNFTQVGGVAANKVARWNGLFWSPMGNIATAPNDIVNALIANGSTLVAGVSIYGTGDWTGFLATWNGASWDHRGDVDNHIETITFTGGEYVVGGSFFSAAGQNVVCLARWNGGVWGPFGGGTVTNVSALIDYRGRMVAGGLFNQHLMGGVTANNIAAWNGVELSSFGSGMNSTVFTLETFKYPGVTGDYELIAGGSFTVAGGLTSNFIARWAEDPISAFPPPAWQPMGVGFNNAVYAIKRHNGQTYAAGAFTSSSGAVSRIARWNETTDVWEPLGVGMNDAVFALESYGGFLYAGGQFTTAGGVSSGGFARWNGTSWSNVGGFFLGTIYSLKVHAGELVIGGLYPGINSSPNLARYNGATYSTYGTGGTDGAVRAIASTPNRLYLGGDFNWAGPGPAFQPAWGGARRTAYWDGAALYPAGEGVDQPVRALAMFQDELHAGGVFNYVREFGMIPSKGWGRMSQSGLPWIGLHPGSQSVAAGSDVTFTSRAAPGYEGSTLQWLHYGNPLGNGPSASSSIISGATSPMLRIDDVTVMDAGPYQLMVTNAVGSDTSSTAMLTVDGITDREPSELPQATLFEALGPNPSRGPTQIVFSLTREAQVRLRVFDVSGRLVRSVIDQRMLPGRHQEVWDGRDRTGPAVQAGIYFVSLEVDGHSFAARRLAVLR